MFLVVGKRARTEDEARLTTWMGIANCAVYTGWSIVLRLIEHRFIEPVIVDPVSPSEMDAVIFLGRRNSCLVLEGSREDIAKYTGAGLRSVSTPIAAFSEGFIQLGSLCVILFIFASIPNGTTWDQIAFIALNVLGQFNVVVGQRVNAYYCAVFQSAPEQKTAETRTDIYAFLLRRFGNGEWVGKAGLIPQTEVWRQWRHVIDKDPNKHNDRALNPRQVYRQIKAKVEDDLVKKVQRSQSADVDQFAAAETPQEIAAAECTI